MLPPRLKDEFGSQRSCSCIRVQIGVATYSEAQPSRSQGSVLRTVATHQILLEHDSAEHGNIATMIDGWRQIGYRNKICEGAGCDYRYCCGSSKIRAKRLQELEGLLFSERAIREASAVLRLSLNFRSSAT